MNHLPGAFFCLENNEGFLGGIQQAINNIAHKEGIYAGDNLFTYSRNLSFLEDTKFMESHAKHSQTQIEDSILWRIYVVAWGALNGMRLGRAILLNVLATKA